jgi:pyridoxamine 5'-phosphate oxidase
MQSIADLRIDYKMKTLLETDVDANPFNQFTNWWNEATESKIDEVNAMTLATATTTGIPSARIVLLKGYNEDGFIFYTNYKSHKANELNANPNACLVFFWKELERQIRIEGTVKKIDENESDTYFASRPTSSKIGAWASPQSKIITSRNVIEENEIKYTQQFKDNNISRPSHWGGYIVQPTVIEFWQGRQSRLHDRLQYSLQNNNIWKLDRLAP